jgi:hypothetical protein
VTGSYDALLKSMSPSQISGALSSPLSSFQMPSLPTGMIPNIGSDFSKLDTSLTSATSSFQPFTAGLTQATSGLENMIPAMGNMMAGGGASMFSSFHSGGVVGGGGGGGYYIPRLHDGLASDEFPAILQRGETVLRRGDSGSGGAITHQINVHVQTNDTTNKREAIDYGKEVGRMVKLKVQECLHDEIRPGGVLNPHLRYK